MTSLKTSIKTITYLSDIGCLEIQGASLDRHQIIASLDLVTNRYWEAEELHEAGVIRDLMENSVPRRYRAGNGISVVKGA